MIETVERIGYAPLTAAEKDEKFTVGTVTWLVSADEGCRQFTADPEGELKEIFADGKVVYSGIKNNGFSITVTTIDALDDIKSAWYGMKKVKEGQMLETSADPTPHVALLEVVRTVAGKYITRVYHFCTISKRLKRDDKTDEGTLDPIFPEHQFKARPLPENGNVLSEYTYDTLTEALIKAIPPAED